MIGYGQTGHKQDKWDIGKEHKGATTKNDFILGGT